MKNQEHADKAGYEEHYNKDSYRDIEIDKKAYVKRYESEYISPYYKGGGTRGYVLYLSVAKLIEDIEEKGLNKKKIKILDAGCGRGELTIYLACLGYNVVGIDISEKGCEIGKNLAKKIGVDNNCEFIATSLENTTLEEDSIDYVIGHLSLHHFIKYELITEEFKRIMKIDSVGFFAEGFGENKLYSIFHDKEKMSRLGDVVLTKKKLKIFFNPQFDIDLIPTDWFTMLDKVFLKIFPEKKHKKMIRKISKLNYHIDRKIPANRTTTFLSGSVLVRVYPYQNKTDS
jgi:ubiquinone/menaquinone biosynthesis C-methylase UbiE